MRRAPRIKIFSTGSEYGTVPPGATMRLDSNGPMVGAMCKSLGLRYRVARPVPDDVSRLSREFVSIEKYPPADLLLSTGGVSVGSHDLVRAALETLGARILFHGVAMRPGKPILFALLPDGRPFFGLPGNPAAALVGFRFFVLAAVRQWLGLSRESGLDIPATARAREGAALFLRARRR